MASTIYTEDQVRDLARTKLHLEETESAQAGVGQIGLFSTNRINKMLIYSLTHSINDTLHFDFLIKNLYHRMIFTACALVSKRYGAALAKGMSFRLFTTAIRETLERKPLSNSGLTLSANKQAAIPSNGLNLTSI